MKKHLILAAVAALATFNACSNDDEEKELEGNAVNFVINGPVTRATTDATGLTTFVNGDKIYLYSNGLQTDMNNTAFTVNNGTLTSDDTFKFKGTEGATFYAFYPQADTDPSATSATFTVSENQSADNAFQQYDVMTASKTLIASQKDAIELNFKHRMALVIVNVQGLTDAQVSAVTINNVVPTATWTYETDKFETSTSSTAINVSMGKNTTDNDTKYYAVIPAQEIAKGNALLTITVGEKTYEYIPSDATTFQANSRTEFKMVFKGNDQVTISGSSLTSQWGDLSSVDASATEYALIPEVYSTTEIKKISNNRTELSPNQWGIQFTSSESSAVANAVADGISIMLSSENVGKQNPSWYNRTLYFKNREGFDLSKTYTLSFYASTQTSTGTIYVSVCNDGSTANQYYQLNSGTDSRVKINPTPSSNLIKQSIVINPAQVSSNVGESQTFTQNTTETTYCIAFAFTSIDTFKLERIRLVENKTE